MPEPIPCALAAVRKSRGLTQGQLGDLVGLTQPHLCNLEHGVAPKGLLSAYKLAAALRCSVEDIWPGLGCGSPQRERIRPATDGPKRLRPAMKSRGKSKR